MLFLHHIKNSFIYCHCSPFIYIHKWEYFS
nr:MAG TPA: hypothetical protein [Inoviridae sp.]